MAEKRTEYHPDTDADAWAHSPRPPSDVESGPPPGGAIGAPPWATPVFRESMGGALIDSARISVMAAMGMLPAPEQMVQILMPGQDEPPPTVHDCLAQAASWLDAARALTVEQAEEPPTSLHVITGTGGGKGFGR